MSKFTTAAIVLCIGVGFLLMHHAPASIHETSDNPPVELKIKSELGRNSRPILLETQFDSSGKIVSWTSLVGGQLVTTVTNQGGGFYEYDKTGRLLVRPTLFLNGVPATVNSGPQ